jgi:hypothetical protein
VGWPHRLLEATPSLARFLERTHQRWLNRQLTFANAAAFTPCQPDY